MENKKINISFIMYGGLTYGGAHKQAIILAKGLNKKKFNINYFWCKHNKDLYSSFVFPEININLIKELENAGVNVIEFKVGYRDISLPYHPWFNTNFFEVFNNYKTDIVFGVRSGYKEFPFNHINKPIIEWNVFGGYDKSNNLIKSISVSEWVYYEYLKNGGNKEKCDYCYVGLDLKIEKSNLRQELGIDDNTIILGFHQRNDDNIFAKYVLDAYKNTKNEHNQETKLVILGGSKKYKDYAKDLDIKDIIFLPVNMDFSYVSKFLNTIDIFTHSAGAGETLGIAVIEAMFHNKPILSMKGINNGHVYVIGDSGLVANNSKDFENMLLKLINNNEYRNEMGGKAFYRANENFKLNKMIIYFEELFNKVYISESNKVFSIDNLNQYSNINFKLISFINRILLKYSNITSSINIFLGNYPYLKRIIKKVLKL